MRNLLLLSNSTVHGTEYLQYAEEYIKEFLNKFSVSSLLFIPFALKDYDNYAEKVGKAFKRIGISLESIHNYKDGVKAISEAEAIYVGGGNTFRLLKSLYDRNLLSAIRERVITDGVPYMGASAGTNVATISICTTNDMPIVYPPSFSALALIPFNINPHYLDPDSNSKHMGETREERIRQYHEECQSSPVVALREGSMLKVEGNAVLLLGLHKARIFYPNKEPKEYDVGSDLSFLLKQEPSE